MPDTNKEHMPTNSQKDYDRFIKQIELLIDMLSDEINQHKLKPATWSKVDELKSLKKYLKDAFTPLGHDSATIEDALKSVEEKDAAY